MDEDGEGYQEEDTGDLYQGFSCNIEGTKATESVVRLLSVELQRPATARAQQVEGQANRKVFNFAIELHFSRCKTKRKN